MADAVAFLAVVMATWLTMSLAARLQAPLRHAPRPLPRRETDTATQAEPWRRTRNGDPAVQASRAREPGRGRGAQAPGQFPQPGWKDIAWRSYREMNEDRLVAVAAGVTFYALLAFFPGIGAFVSLYGLFADAATVNDHVASLAGVLPGGALEVIGDQVKRIAAKDDATLGLAFFLGLAVSLWSANAGMKAMFDALNVVFDEAEKRSFIVLNSLSLLFTLGAMVFLNAALGAIAILPMAFDFIGLGTTTEWLVRILRWPALLAVVIACLSLLYRYGPSRRQAKWRWVTWGATLAGLLWIAASVLFSWYAAHYGSYDATYGSLGAVIGFMTWIWISAIIVLLGAELNAEMEHQTARDTTKGAEKPLGMRGATMADGVGEAQGR